MAYIFELNRESLKREFAVYVVLAQRKNKYQLYVGKTGDNREGCNPLISRCGNHFSYNKIHSQIRNKISQHEKCEYTYVFDHFSKYSENDEIRESKVDEINEIERWVNVEIQKLCENISNCVIVNPFKGKGFINKSERKHRESFHNKRNSKKVTQIINVVNNKIGS